MIVFPNAKINIGLFVTEKRTDGFHNLETIFYPIGLSDVLEITEEHASRGTCLFQNTGIDIACEPEKNLILRAYYLLAGRFDLPAVHVHLHKLIPFGAGLGGGSSDAAFMLKALNDFFELHLSEQMLMELAVTLGSDCAFFIRNHPAFATGKGECLEEIELSLANYRLVLVKPSIAVSTPEAYAGITPQPAFVNLRALNRWEVSTWKEKVFNDFEKSVFAKYPQIAQVKEQLYQAGALYASMTGSGSAIYALFEKGKGEDLNFQDCFVWQE